MQTETLVALVVFAGLGAAVWLLAVACTGPIVPVMRSRPVLVALAGPRVAAAGGTVLAVGVLTRWPVAALGAGALVWAWPRLVGGNAASQAGIARLEALAGWTESLKDTIAGAIGLEEAIPATAPTAAAPIRGEVERLVERLRAREPLPAALHRFAADLDDPSADLVVAALILNARLRGPGLRATLEALATSARDELDMRRRVDAGRRALRSGVRIIVGVTVAFVGALIALDSAYLDPYDTATGQLVLLLVAAMFTAAFAWLRALSEVTVPQRLLTKHGHEFSGADGPSSLTRAASR
ncbi:type II secretion system F family protein [Sporichthya polymorpha]|uniref:type II secretion system F family protein n=1 Tax=Sporichthya polymorpha TaxID=35751 RepID=UPI0003AA24EE|nr:type II secretion system F family protein [Sporichthya polymorpha]